MKKLLTVFLGLFLLVGFSACGAKNDQNKDEVIQAYVDKNNAMTTKNAVEVDMGADFNVKKSATVPNDVNLKLDFNLKLSKKDGCAVVTGNLESKDIVPLLRAYFNMTGGSNEKINLGVALDSAYTYVNIDNKWYKEKMSASDAKGFQDALKQEGKTTKKDMTEYFDTLSNAKYEINDTNYVITATIDYKAFGKMGKIMPAGDAMSTSDLQDLKKENFKMTLVLTIPKSDALETQMVIKDISANSLGTTKLGPITINIKASDDKIVIPAAAQKGGSFAELPAVAY